MVTGKILVIDDDDSTLRALQRLLETAGLPWAKTACILPGVILACLGLKSEATAVVDASGAPFATMMMDKTVLDETHPNYIGIYQTRTS